MSKRVVRSGSALAVVFALVLVLTMLPMAAAQETTGGLQGTVKDPSGAVVPGAQVVVTGTALVGKKEIETDASGYYRFANLPPGTYTITVTAKGFRTVKREGLILAVGHLPTVDIALEVGVTTEVVEVTSAAVMVDTTTNTTVNNVTEDLIKFIPHGDSFQSILQFSPMARNEPLMGANIYNGNTGTGGCSPSGCNNGAAQGYQVGGAADSENSYLVEGQSTNNNIGGYSHTNVPFDLIQEVEIKSSGIEAQYGGALGGVANVIMKKGGNEYHGSVVVQYNNDAFNGANSASTNDYTRYDPTFTGCVPGGKFPNGSPCPSFGGVDPVAQQYNPQKDGYTDFLPGFTLGGPIKKDRLWFFVGFNPEFTKLRRTVAENGSSLHFDQNAQAYYSSARVDAAVTNKIRVHGSWFYDYQRESGQNLPRADSTQGILNVSSTIPSFAFSHALGFTVPSQTTSVGADWTITPRLISSTQFSYFFENYHDFGFPSNGTIFIWQASGIGGTEADGKTALPANLQQANAFFNVAQNPNTTLRNANKHVQFDQGIGWTKSGWAGTHNFKFGYQLNVESNDIFQRWNEPEVDIFPGTVAPYVVQGPVGAANCAGQPLVTHDKTGAVTGCAGTFGIATVRDYGSYGYAQSFNHGLYAQDAWTIGHGITINAGIRFDKEYLPAENQPTGGVSHPIDFSWTDKVAPRVGAAWDVMRNGKLKLFGSYGVFYDIMKLNLAISSFGGQYWQNCNYALNTSDLSVITPVFAGGKGRDCVGPDSASQANWAQGSTPPGLVFLENQNFRTFPTTCSTCSVHEEGVAPGLKPYRQHESVFGADYVLSKNLALEARWDRRRLDHAIEDSAIFNPAIGETFVIVNPGQGVNTTFNGFYQFISGQPVPACSGNACPPQTIIPAERNYDGVEVRLTRSTSNHWMGMFSYTYSRLWGNYPGLTTTDWGDGFAGRNSPNNSRSFDEPFFSYGSNGQSSSGLLPTDRPHAFKGYAYYELNEGRHNATDFGVFSYLYSGSPETTVLDVGFAFSTQPAFPVDVAGRGKWLNIAQNPTTGAISVGNPITQRTPWFASSDVNLGHNYKFGESKTITFSVTASNIFNKRAVTGVYESPDSLNSLSFIAPGGLILFAGPPAYAAYERPYNVAALLNNAPTAAGTGPITLNSQYGKPALFQQPRNIRLGLRFTF